MVLQNLERPLPPRLVALLTERKYRWGIQARPAQLPPAWDWDVWLVKAGRGWGKSRTGAEFIRDQVTNHGKRRAALVGRTAADARDVMVEGEAGLLAISPPWFEPKYEPSKRRLTWPNGAIATTYSGDEPKQLRGPAHDVAWCDELSTWRYIAAWDNLLLGLRIGSDPQVVVTTTPRAIAVLKELVADALSSDPTTALSGGSTYENIDNLAPAFKARILRKYEGTTLGRQELWAEILEDIEGALWTLALIEKHRVSQMPELVRIVVGVDPAMTSGRESNETGIIVAGLGTNQHGYVLDDVTLRGKPMKWARQAINAFTLQEADKIVAEINNGGEMVETTLRTIDPNIPYKAVHASRGKRTRAEPISSLYEQGRVHHVGVFGELEDQMTSWVPGEKSPDRMDALVWALTELMIGIGRSTPTPIVSPAGLTGDSLWRM